MIFLWACREFNFGKESVKKLCKIPLFPGESGFDGSPIFRKFFFRLFLTANPTETIIIYCYTELHNEQKCDPFFALYLKFSRKKQKTQLKISIGTS